MFEREEYQLYENQIYWFYGCFAGILIFIIIFNVFLQITLNDVVHTWYTLYIMFILLFVLADTGLGYEFFWGSYPELNKHVRTFTGISAFVLQLHFMQMFISQTANNSRVYHAVNWNKLAFLLLAVFAALPLILNFELPPLALSLFNTSFSIAYFSGIVLVGLSLTETIYSKNRTGLIYFLAIVPLMIQVIVVLLSRWHLISLPLDTSLTMSLSILVEITILTLGLTIRYNYFKFEKDKLENALVLQRKNTVEKVLGAQEEERRRVASDLHDDLGGTLSSIKGILSGIQNKNENEAREILVKSQKLLDKACDDLRFIAHDLMPADFSSTQLRLAIEESIAKLNSSSNIEFEFILVGPHRQLDRYLELNIYRILNELLHNVRKHSGATHAIIQVIYHEDFFQLMVEDNGGGFDVKLQGAAAGIGLKNIHSRIEYINGKIYFDSGNHGTTITCNIPYPI
jgi:signal transduction histidine kinase